MPQKPPCPECGGIGGIANHKRTCTQRCPTSKIRYGTRQSALMALTTAKLIRFKRESGWGNRRETRVYECPKCGGWHLTSMAAPPKKE